MASTDNPEVGARVDPSCSAGDNVVEQGNEEEEYSGIVEGLRSLVFGETQSINIDEIRELIVKKLPASACGAEDAIAPIRANLWSAMLLGLRPEDLNRYVFTSSRLVWVVASLHKGGVAYMYVDTLMETEERYGSVFYASLLR